MINTAFIKDKQKHYDSQALKHLFFAAVTKGLEIGGNPIAVVGAGRKAGVQRWLCCLLPAASSPAWLERHNFPCALQRSSSRSSPARSCQGQEVLEVASAEHCHTAAGAAGAGRGFLQTKPLPKSVENNPQSPPRSAESIERRSRSCHRSFPVALGKIGLWVGAEGLCCSPTSWT